jgi:hypothetical protein
MAAITTLIVKIRERQTRVTGTESDLDAALSVIVARLEEGSYTVAESTRTKTIVVDDA